MPKDFVEDCVFCDESKIANTVITFGDVMVFQPLNPVTRGHLLVVPKKHVQDYVEDPNVTARVMKVAAQYAATNFPESNIITSMGKNASQSVFHFHVHIVPRRENDGLLLPWTGKEALEEAARLGAEKERAEILAMVEYEHSFDILGKNQFYKGAAHAGENIIIRIRERTLPE